MPSEKQLKKLAAIAALSRSFDAPQQDEQKQRMAMALQMLGLQQQKAESDAVAAFRQSQLGQQGVEAEANAAFRQQQLAQQGREVDVAGNRNFIGALDLLNQPQTTPLVRQALRNRPGFEQVGSAIDQLDARDRAALIARLVPELKAISDPKAREFHGRTQSAAFPGADAEAMAIAYPPAQAPPVATSSLQGPIFPEAPSGTTVPAVPGAPGTIKAIFDLLLPKAKPQSAEDYNYFRKHYADLLGGF